LTPEDLVSGSVRHLGRQERTLDREQGRPFMPSSRPPAPTDDLARDLVVRSVTSWIVDVPRVRRYKLSSLSITAQSYVIVKLRLTNGVDGIARRRGQSSSCQRTNRSGL
jgi:hypothetical protein